MFIRMTAAAVPPRMKGVRRPSFVWHLSDSLPKNGSRNSASTLSMAITTPTRLSFMWNVFFKIRGITLSYSCQNAQMDRNAKPTSSVRC